jgi:hypothetical protein
MRSRRAAALFALFVVPACGGAAPAPRPLPPPPDAAAPAPTPPETPAKPRLAVAASDPAPSAPLSPEAAALRDQGLRAMAEGRFVDARDAFARVLERFPGDIAAKALLDAADAANRASQERAAVELSSKAPIVLARPPFTRTLRRPAVTGDAGRVPKLVKVSEARNAITDDEAWFRDNALSLPLLATRPRQPGASALPPGLPTSYGGERLVTAIAHPDHTILIFGATFADGRYVVVLDATGRVLSIFDFANYLRAPTVVPGDEQFVEQSVGWAELKDGVLYVSNGHRTYAKSSGGQNAYLTALDATSGELLWRSAPLVANAANFVVDGGAILTGYGFTAEPDFLYVVDRSTGEVRDKIRVASGAAYLIRKDGRLFVRTYDTNYVFELR